MNSSAPEEPVDPPMTAWKRFRVMVKVVELRLRFVALMAATALVFGYWDTIGNYYGKWTRPRGVAAATASDTEYFCPMHPSVIQGEPGSCPICGMPLSPRKKGQAEALPPGVTARVRIDAPRVVQAGIATAEVGYEPLSETITTVGSVVVDERRLARISSNVKDRVRVEKLYVNFTGTKVDAGAELAEVYGPELQQALREMILASRRAAAPAPSRPLGGRPDDLLRASREKLTLWGFSAKQLDEVIARGEAPARLAILSPISGTVLKKNVVEGQYVMEGEPMFEVADLSRVWVRAQVFEDRIGLVRVGQPVEARVEARPGEAFRGEVAFTDPSLDPSTRTMDVRFDLDNADGRLMPGMFARVKLTTPIADSPAFRDRVAKSVAGGGLVRKASLTVDEQKACLVTGQALGSMGDPVPVEVESRKLWMCCSGCEGRLRAEPKRYLARLVPPPRGGVLSVPEGAVIDSGTRKVVYVEVEPGVFEGREVVLGPLSGGSYPVLEGLHLGEKVAAAGAFLIDAESRLHAAAEPRVVEHPH